MRLDGGRCGKWCRPSKRLWDEWGIREEELCFLIQLILLFFPDCCFGVLFDSQKIPAYMAVGCNLLFLYELEP